ncbi:MAG TPA: HAD family hydrolase [Bryobacteraceae bacterium]|nr:HAD family hydrolase [Bryobacteraceae bacterium]
MDKRRALVLFDIDGTLLRGAGPHHKQALIDGIRRVTGVETHLNGVATAGMLDRDLILHMLKASGYADRRSRAALRQIVDACQDAYLHNCAADLSTAVCAGAAELLEELTGKGAAIGLVTGNLSGIGWKKVELAGLRRYFFVGAFAEDGLTRRRLARIAWQRARKAGLIGQDASVSLIGDHMNDVEAAKANGFRAIAVASGLTPAHELEKSQPDILVQSLCELNVNQLV